MANIKDDKKTYKFRKFCKLESCKKVFLTNREWQDFCEPPHQQEYWKIVRKEAGGVLRRLTTLEKENKDIKARLGVSK